MTKGVSENELTGEGRRSFTGGRAHRRVTGVEEEGVAPHA